MVHEIITYIVCKGMIHVIVIVTWWKISLESIFNVIAIDAFPWQKQMHMQFVFRSSISYVIVTCQEIIHKICFRSGQDLYS